jgi:hypothetical protein
MLKSIFTWWNGATIGARFDIGRQGWTFVGQDDAGQQVLRGAHAQAWKAASAAM